MYRDTLWLTATWPVQIPREKHDLTTHWDCWLKPKFKFNVLLLQLDLLWHSCWPSSSTHAHYINIINVFLKNDTYCLYFSSSFMLFTVWVQPLYKWPFLSHSWFLGTRISPPSHCSEELKGYRSSRHQGISPPTTSPPRNHLATNHYY